MPRLWSDTIGAHRRAVHEATLDAAAALVTKYGLASVTMSRIAVETGIGRATLYKYFPSVEAIVTAWHVRHVNQHLEHLAEVQAGSGEIGERLEAVLEAYAFISHEQRRGTELAALLHRGKHVARANRRLNGLIRSLIAEGAKAGVLRNDVASHELASYCIHALTASSTLSSRAAIIRLVKVTLDGLLSRTHGAASERRRAAHKSDK